MRRPTLPGPARGPHDAEAPERADVPPDASAAALGADAPGPRGRPDETRVFAMSRRHMLHLLPLAVAAGCVGASDAPADAPDDADDADDDAEETDSPAADDCAPTDGDIEGPFYRADAPERDDLAVSGDTGTVLLLSGRVLQADGCTPLAGAVVDLWQADPEGAYDNDSAELRYRGRARADADGRWALRTLEPGRYRNGSTYRPAHLHVKLWVDGVERLTTQLYFPDDPYNATDPWYDPAREVIRGEGGAATYDFVL